MLPFACSSAGDTGPWPLDLTPRLPPDLLQLPRELLLPPDDYGDVILPLHHLHVGPAQPFLHVVGALHRDHLVVLAVEDIDLALEAVPDGIEVGVELASCAADDVVEGVPRGVVSVAAEAFDQVCPKPEGTHLINRRIISLIQGSCTVQAKWTLA